jgi:hypothetical protein
LGECLGQSTKRVAIATLFGAVTFITKIVVPSPIDKMFIVVHALLLGLGALLLRRMGATYVAVIGGVLTALWRVALAPFTFLFALLYGLFVDGFFIIFKVNPVGGEVKTVRLVASMTLSTALVGFLSYYVTVFMLGLLQRNLVLEVSILAIGTLSGAVAGYFTSIIWNKYLKNAKF